VENTYIWDKDKTAFQIKSYNPEHKCKEVLDTHHVSLVFLTRKYLDTIRDGPDIKWKILIRIVKRGIGLTLPSTRHIGLRERLWRKFIVNLESSILLSSNIARRETNSGSKINLMVDRM